MKVNDLTLDIRRAWRTPRPVFFESPRIKAYASPQKLGESCHWLFENPCSDTGAGLKSAHQGWGPNKASFRHHFQVAASVLLPLPLQSLHHTPKLSAGLELDRAIRHSPRTRAEPVLQHLGVRPPLPEVGSRAVHFAFKPEIKRWIEGHIQQSSPRPRPCHPKSRCHRRAEVRYSPYKPPALDG